MFRNAQVPVNKEKSPKYELDMQYISQSPGMGTFIHKIYLKKR